jgi:DedD protein
MDQTLKERLIGMAVLLLLGVIFIPWILDGNQAQLKDSKELSLPVPSAGASHEMSFTDGTVKRIELPVPQKENSSQKKVKQDSVKPGINQALPDKSAEGSNGDSQISKKTQVLSSESNSSNTTKLQKPVSGNVVSLNSSDRLQSTTAKSKAEIERVLNDPSAAWVVQIGSFSERNNAEKEVAALRDKGFPAFMSRFVTANEQVLYRVRVGPEKERARAERLAERLNSAGIKGQVVAHP